MTPKPELKPLPPHYSVKMERLRRHYGDEFIKMLKLHREYCSECQLSGLREAVECFYKHTERARKFFSDYPINRHNPFTRRQLRWR